MGVPQIVKLSIDNLLFKRVERIEIFPSVNTFANFENTIKTMKWIAKLELPMAHKGSNFSLNRDFNTVRNFGEGIA